MDLEKAYIRVDWQALWDVLKIYGVGEKQLSAIKSFYEEASACVEISEETSEHFETKVGLRQGHNDITYLNKIHKNRNKAIFCLMYRPPDQSPETDNKLFDVIIETCGHF